MVSVAVPALPPTYPSPHLFVPPKRGTGSRGVCHRLNQEERIIWEQAKTRGYLRTRGVGYRRERRGSPLANTFRQYCDALGRVMVHVAQDAELDTIYLDYSPLRAGPPDDVRVAMTKNTHAEMATITSGGGDNDTPSTSTSASTSESEKTSTHTTTASTTPTSSSSATTAPVDLVQVRAWARLRAHQVTSELGLSPPFPVGSPSRLRDPNFDSEYEKYGDADEYDDVEDGQEGVSSSTVVDEDLKVEMEREIWNRLDLNKDAIWRFPPDVEAITCTRANSKKVAEALAPLLTIESFHRENQDQNQDQDQTNEVVQLS